MKIVKKLPGMAAEVIDVEISLESLQKEVEGIIEAVTLVEGVAFICNEEGRLLGMQPNIIINGVDFVGPLLVVGVQGEHFSGLPNAERWAQFLNS